MRSNEINYSPLEGYRFWDNLLAAVRKTFQSKRYWIINAVWAVSVVPYLLDAINTAGPGEELPLSVLGVFPLLLLFWVWYYFAHLRNKKLDTLASANSWTIRPYAHGDALPTCLAGSKYGGGASKVIEMEVDGVGWSLFAMDMPDSKKQMFTVFRAHLEKEISPMLLDSRRTEGYLTIPKGWKKLQLEGSFPEHFSLRVPENSQIDVLSYLAPDLMELLVENNKLNDIEISNNHVFVISDHDARNQNILRKIIPSLSRIYTKVS